MCVSMKMATTTSSSPTRLPEVLSAQQEAWLRDEMTDINAKIYASDKDNCAWAEKVDLDGSARYFFWCRKSWTTTSRSTAAATCTASSAPTTEWIFGPVWDFGSSNITTTKTRTIAEDRMWHRTWIGEMVKFPAFIDKVKEVWTDFYTSGAINDVIDYVSATAERIDRAAKTDKQRWPEYGNDDVREKSEVINRNLRNRMLWINNLYGQSLPGKVITVYFEDNNPSPWDNVKGLLSGAAQAHPSANGPAPTANASTVSTSILPGAIPTICPYCPTMWVK